jgi:agmatine/peptidylarginine deiminase
MDRIEEGRPTTLIPPTGLELVNPAEFCKADGMLLPWPGWGHQLIGDVAYAIAEDDPVFMIVRDASHEASAYNYLSNRGVNMDNVEFIHDARVSGSSMWIRDWGPFCICEDGREAIVDFYYGVYPGDDQIPMTIAEYFELPYYNSNLLHHGGNHITDGNGMAFASTNIWNYNQGYSHEEVRDIFRDYLGIDSLLVFEPMHGDITGHIDMFCKILNDSLFIVGEYETPEDAFPGDYELLNQLADSLTTLQNLDGRSFSVVRMPTLPIEYGGPAGRINRTYTNSLILNDNVLVPIYGVETDDVALGIYAELMPDHDIIGIDSEFIIAYAGAVHCMTNCIHSPNPLIVLHRPMEELMLGDPARLAFTLNPRFESTGASVYYKLDTDLDYSEMPAQFVGGYWRVELPPMTEDFSYFIYGWATSGFSFFEVTLPEDAPLDVFHVDVRDPASVAEAFGTRLDFAAYPNPFHPTTTISFVLPEPGRVKVTIYDAAGRLVSTPLHEQRMTAGRHSIVWTGRDDRGRGLGSGVYLGRIDAGDRYRAAKLILAP